MDRKRVFPVLFPFSVGWLVACLITERVQDCLRSPDCGGTTSSSRITEEGGGGGGRGALRRR